MRHRTQLIQPDRFIATRPVRRGVLTQLLLLLVLPEIVAAQTESIRPLVIEPPTIAAEDRSFELEGHAPDGPRSLKLWGWQHDRFQLLAVTRTTSDGRFRFGPLPLPPNLQRLRVSLAGDTALSGPEIQIETPANAPRVALSGLDPFEISIFSPAPGGTLRIRDEASGRLLWQRSVSRTERGAQRWVRLDLESEGLIQFEGPLLIDHAGPDGRLSPPVRWPLAP